NPEDRATVDQRVAEERPFANDRLGAQTAHEVDIIENSNVGRRPDRQEEQQDVQPPPVLEPGIRWRKRRENGQPPMFWRSLPGLNRMVRPGGIRTSLPVRGLRPMPRLRGLTWNTPKPRSSIRSPRCIDTRIASNTASTATSALTLVMSAIFETSLTMSTLIIP